MKENSRQILCMKDVLRYHDAISNILKGKATTEDHLTKIILGAKINGFELGKIELDSTGRMVGSNEI